MPYKHKGRHALVWLTKITLARRPVDKVELLGSGYKMAEHFLRFMKKMGELLTNDIERTARRQLNGRDLLYGEY